MFSFAKFFPEPVAAFCSDRSRDFRLVSALDRKHLESVLQASISQIAILRQVHGNTVVKAEAQIKDQRYEAPAADGLITNFPGVALTIKTADCLPVFLYDPRRKAVGLVHAGWRGTQQQIAVKAVETMGQEYGTSPQDVQVAFGPAIRPCCYEVGSEFVDHFQNGGLKRRDDRWYLDLVEVNRSQLLGVGVLAENILDSRQCTCCALEFFSYRREKDGAGRHLSLIMLT